MPKLNQIIALVTGKKTKVQKELTELYKKLQKPTLFDGLLRKYRPDDEEGETYPDESKKIQEDTKDIILQAEKILTDLFDLVLTQDSANTEAKATVVVDENLVIPDIPVTYLLFLEKQLVDLRTFFEHMPVLDPSEQWNWSKEKNCYESELTYTNKTKKVPRNHVKAEATKEHPAQVEMYMEDVKVGRWTNSHFSTAISKKEKADYLERIQKLQDAIKCAREEANMHEVTNREIGKKIFGFLLEM